ncbi:MAG: hydroxyacid dehydrogenase [Bacteroidota bacterium]
MSKILLLETISPEADTLLRGAAEVRLAETPYSGPDIARDWEVEAIVTRGKGDVSAALIDACPKLRVIARCGVGLDNVEVRYATQKGIAVVNAPGSNADTVAEHTLGLMLSLQRRTYASIAAVKAENWDYRKEYGGDEIRGKTLGILGYGDIGQRVGRLAEAFGMRVHFLARPQVPGGDQDGSARSLDELLREADILSLHLPLTERTRLILNVTNLLRSRPGQLIINTARGGLIDEAALLRGLQSGRIGGYAADVLQTEPPAAASPLLALPNVLVTPHAASLTARTYNQMCVLTAHNTLALLKGEDVEEKYIFNRADLPRHE